METFINHDEDVCLRAQSLPSCLTLCYLMDCQALLSMGFCRQDYGVGCQALLQGIFPTQGSNLSYGLLCLLHSQAGSYH